MEKIENEQARNLVSRLLSRDLSKRPSLKAVLAHPFISGKAAIRMVGQVAAHHFFISYRVASDAAHAEKLYNLLTAMGLNVWWDKKCLKTGENWEEGFCKGLVNSQHFICLWSKGAINHPTVTWQNFAHLKEESRCDNVFLEYRMALELKALGLVDTITPVLIGDADNEASPSTYGKYFAGGCNQTASPDISVKAVEDSLQKHMAAQALGSPLVADRTVKSVMDELGKMQGVFVEGEATVAWDGASKKISEVVERAKKQSHEGKVEPGASESTATQQLRAALTEIKEKYAALEEQRSAFVAALKKKDAALKEKDAAIEDQKSALKEKDAAIEEQRSAFELALEAAGRASTQNGWQSGDRD
jgi:hypothetical protein